jgi:hypothetical protein
MKHHLVAYLIQGTEEVSAMPIYELLGALHRVA